MPEVDYQRLLAYLSSSELHWDRELMKAIDLWGDASEDEI